MTYFARKTLSSMQWWDRYKIRFGIEATISELGRRWRGQPNPAYNQGV
jgi:hypothetical protein